MGVESPAALTSSGSPEDNLAKMIKHQERMFGLEIKKDMVKMEHEAKMNIAQVLGQAARTG